jgi:thymidine phosphorylase
MKTNARHPESTKDLAISAIKKKLIGKQLSYNEIFAIMDQIANERLGPVLTTYFAAAGFKEGFTNDELFSLTKAMVATGPKLHLRGIVAGKHSTGGVAGTRTTMIVVPIIAAAGYKIPKNSTRAITSPAGTADTMEVLAPVSFSIKEIESFVGRVGACIVEGSFLGLAPADDVIIEIEKPLSFESYDKFIVSIMAKQIASGVTHLILDIPVGPTMKIQHFKDAAGIANKFTYLAKRFGINVIADINETRQNAGNGIGPILEARDVLAVLQQLPERALALEERAIRLAGKLLGICFSDTPARKNQNPEAVARELLSSGKAWDKMKEIIKTQGGRPDVTMKDLQPGAHYFKLLAKKGGKIIGLDNQQISAICRILGCPTDKKAGMYLDKKINDVVSKGDILCTLYASDKWRLAEATETLKHIIVYRIR